MHALQRGAYARKKTVRRQQVEQECTLLARTVVLLDAQTQPDHLLLSMEVTEDAGSAFNCSTWKFLEGFVQKENQLNEVRVGLGINQLLLGVGFQWKLVLPMAMISLP